MNPDETDLGALKRADRRAIGWGVVGATGLAVVGSFWAFSPIEDELDAAAAEVANYRELEGASVEWNGRDGYLTLPAGYSPLRGELLAEELADLSGARDVEIVGYDGVASPDAASPDAANADAATAGEPAAFRVDWSDDDRTASGVVPNGTANAYNALFAVAGIEPEIGRSLSPEVEERLQTVVAPLIGEAIPEGSLVVVDNTITITGSVPDEETLSALTASLVDAGIDSVDLTLGSLPAQDSDVEAEAASPANFGFEWDADTTVAWGTLVPENTTITDEVGDGLDALAALVSDSLVSGTGEVSDGDTLTVVGRAADADSLAAAEETLDALGVNHDLSVSQELAAQDALDAVLELQRVEFVSGTAIPTEATAEVVDQVADVLNQFEAITIDIEGHTDSQGGDAANLTLSEQRAAAIAAALTERGIDEGRMTTAGFGETEPIDTNETEAGRQNNRRVEITAKESN